MSGDQTTEPEVAENPVIEEEAVVETPEELIDRSRDEGAPVPPSRWKQTLRAIKEIDGALLLLGLMLTVAISFVIYRKNRIDDNVYATHVVLDYGLETILAQQIDGPLTRDDPLHQKRMSVLKYRAYVGEYRVDPARRCVGELLTQIEDFGIDSVRVSYIADGTPVQTGEYLIRKISNLRDRLNAWKWDKRWFLHGLKSSDSYFEECFEKW